MSAVFKSETAYYQINKLAVLRSSPVYCPEMVLYTESGLRVTFQREIVGRTDGIAYQKESYESYVFCEGEHHNLLTLTDETEIAKMREYIVNRPQIEEVTENREE